MSDEDVAGGVVASGETVSVAEAGSIERPGEGDPDAEEARAGEVVSWAVPGEAGGDGPVEDAWDASCSGGIE
jgi:hypothetical protein